MRGRLAVLAALAVCALLSACKKESVAPSPDVWATVNGTEIRREEVEKYYRSRVNPEGQEPSHEEALSLKLQILDELINNEILLQRATKLGLVATDGEVEDKFTESKSPYTEEEFQRKLKENGLTTDDLKRELRRQISVQKLLNREVVSKITITDQDVTDFFNQNRAQFNVAETQYRISEIVVTSHPDPQLRNRKSDDATNDAEAKRKIAMLQDRLANGADFAQLAMDYSEDPSASSGGDLGYISESSLAKSDPALRRAVLTLKAGEVSKPIPQRDGYMLLKLVAREPAGQRQINDPQVQSSIRETLRNRKEQLLRAAFLSTVRGEAHVMNYLAQQILESNGKLPADLPKPPGSAAAPQSPTP